LNLIEKAIEVAAVAHEKQYRKSTNVPYITHPVSVGFILMKYHCSENVVAAGILHDTVEDTNLTFEDIRNLFGSEIEEIVRGASEENKELSWEERKEHTISTLQTASQEVCLVVCADKLHNLRTIKRDLDVNGEMAWSRFKRGRQKQQWYYYGVYEALSKQLNHHPLIDELKAAINEVFEK